MKNKNVSVLMLLGLIFGAIGIVFAAIGIILRAGLGSEYMRGDIGLLPHLFTGMGLAFILATVVLMSFHGLKGKKKNYLLESGRVIYAHVDRIEKNRHVQVNSKYPYNLFCSYTDPATGEVHKFKSDNYFGDLSYYVDKDVKVYIDGNDYSYYIIDVDESKIM